MTHPVCINFPANVSLSLYSLNNSSPNLIEFFFQDKRFGKKSRYISCFGGRILGFYIVNKVALEQWQAHFFLDSVWIWLFLCKCWEEKINRQKIHSVSCQCIYRFCLQLWWLYTIHSENSSLVLSTKFIKWEHWSNTASSSKIGVTSWTKKNVSFFLDKMSLVAAWQVNQSSLV